MYKLEPLQDLRGIAVIMVVTYHAGGIFVEHILPYEVDGLGVRLFFMISGFIMAYIHGCDKGVQAFILFAKKRVVRIYPAYIPVFLCFYL